MEAYLEYLEARSRLRAAQEGALRARPRPGADLAALLSEGQAARMLSELSPSEVEAWVSVNHKLMSRMAAHA